MRGSVLLSGMLLSVALTLPAFAQQAAPTCEAQLTDLQKTIQEEYRSLLTDQVLPQVTAPVAPPATAIGTIGRQLRIVNTQYQRETGRANQETNNVAVLVEENRTLRETLKQVRAEVDTLKNGQKAAEKPGAAPAPVAEGKVQ